MDRRAFVAATGALALLPLTGARAAETILLRDLYNKDLSFSDFALSLQDTEVSVTGFMAPPLKAQSKFFVMTKMPMAVCPFCESEAQWPDDIVAVYTTRVLAATPAFNVPLITTGNLRLGTYRDEELGFVSRVRLTEASFVRG
jgi:hypothetical protein